MALRLPLKSSARTTSFVTLHRPPPEIRIFAPIRFALSWRQCAHAMCGQRQ
jgi:hypothetical protein